MNEQNVQRQAAEYALELPAAELTHPFGEEWDVYKVRGKVFMLQSEVTGTPMTTLKAGPADAAALREAHERITAGYHMNKRHWITIRPGADLPDDLLRDLVTESYLLVVERNLPKKDWPVDPATFGPYRGAPPEVIA